MCAVRVETIEINSFRRFRDITIPFGENITIIAGQNGTAKSTLLGMLAQPFSFGVLRGSTAKKPDESKYIKNYHGIKLHEYKDLAGRQFMYDCDNVFRLSKEFDFGKIYQYETKLSIPESVKGGLPDNSLMTKSRTRKKPKSKERKMRFVTGPGASHESGEGNFPHPVIYLGLNRLWPLAESKDCKFSSEELEKKDRDWFVEKYNEILCLDEHKIDAQFMDTSEKKKFITPHSNDYDGESCSAGQDNLSQILTAILSFKGLKKKLKNKYLGGLLLIDELDATLHAFSQDKLLEMLCEESKDLKLQIIATSHSLRILELAYQSRLNKDIKVIHLANEDGNVVKKSFSTYQEISDHLKVQATPPSKNQPKQKVSVVFEDKEAEFFFKQICGSKLRNYIRRANTTSLGAGKLKNLADMSEDLTELQNAIFVPDGDMARTWTDPPENLLPLPGGKRPETLVYQHLYSMKDSDSFWSNTYTRQFAITSKGGSSLEKGDNKEWVKEWYRNQSQYWGRENSEVYKSWVNAHKSECLEFTKKFIKLLKQRYKGDIPKEVINRTLAQFKDS